jgi:hypothetical protein
MTDAPAWLLTVTVPQIGAATVASERKVESVVGRRSVGGAYVGEHHRELEFEFPTRQSANDAAHNIRSKRRWDIRIRRMGDV